MIFSKIKAAAGKITHKFSEAINDIFYKRKLDAEALAELEELLILSDLGVASTELIIKEISSRKFGQEVSADDIKLELADIITKMIDLPINDPKISDSFPQRIILMCGVNGNGKTTSIGKLAAMYQSLGNKVMMAACDTFRAAAPEQLQNWAQKVGCDIEIGEEKSDPASVAFKAIAKARADKIDILFIDTAGRLQNQKNLMDELKKIVHIIKKQDPLAPHETFLVIDATTGQNAIAQVEHFMQIADLSGLIVTKLDGTAKAGIVVNIAQKFKLPVKYVATGESLKDIAAFDAAIFAKSLVRIS